MSRPRISLFPCWRLPSALLIAVFVAGCVQPGAVDGAEEQAPAPAGEAEVLARVGDTEITRAELEEELQSELRAIEQQRYQVLKQGLDQRVAEKLIELEAAAAGVDNDALLAEKVYNGLTPATDAEVDAFYEENRARINQPKATVAPRIREFLSEQARQRAVGEYLKGLRQKYGVRTFLEPVRITVEADGHPAKGPADAPVTLVEFSDFECPFCARVLPTLEQITERYGDKVRVVFRQFPLANIHPNAMKAAEASLCAHDQGKFWPMHDAMFANQRQLGVAALKQTAADLGLDSEAFDTCLDSGRYGERVNADLAAGSEAGVSGTPALFVNGRPLPAGAQPFEVVAEVIDEELAARGAS